MSLKAIYRYFYFFPNSLLCCSNNHSFRLIGSKASVTTRFYGMQSEILFRVNKSKMCLAGGQIVSCLNDFLTRISSALDCKCVYAAVHWRIKNFSRCLFDGIFRCVILEIFCLLPIRTMGFTQLTNSPCPAQSSCKVTCHLKNKNYLNSSPENRRTLFSVSMTKDRHTHRQAPETSEIIINNNETHT